MSGARLEFETIVAELLPLLTSFPGVYIGHGYQVDYVEKFKDTQFAVWVRNQRSNKISVSQGYAGHHRETHQVEFLLTVNVPRVVTGSNNADQRIKALFDAAFAILLGWKPEGASRPFSCNASNDADSNSSYISVNFVLSTEVVYQRGN